MRVGYLPVGGYDRGAEDRSSLILPLPAVRDPAKLSPVMSAWTWDWGWQGGFSQLLEELELEAGWVGKPWRTEWVTRPASWWQGRPELEGCWQVAQATTLRLPGGARWRLSPKLLLQVRLLPAEKRYLGSYKVRKGMCALHWRVDGQLAAELTASEALWSIRTMPRIRLSWDWVMEYPQQELLKAVLEASWKEFVNLLDPGSVGEMRDRCVARFRWSGGWRRRWTADWEVDADWGLGSVGGDLLQWRQSLTGLAGWEFEASLDQDGVFQIDAARRDPEFQLSIRRNLGRETGSAFTLSVGFRQRASIKSPVKLLDPALRPIRDGLQRALTRRLELAVSAQASRLHSEKILWRGVWKPFSPENVLLAYSALLEGRRPSPGPGFRWEYSLEEVEERRSVIQVQLLNQRRREKVRRRSKERKVAVDPLGNLVLSEEERLEEIRYWSDRLQFQRLLAGPEMDRLGSLTWYWGMEGRWSRRELRQRLRVVLHTGALGEFELWGPENAAESRMVWITTFSTDGLERIRQTSSQARFEGLVGAWKLTEPELYGPGGCLRDWTDVPEVRREVDRNPAQAHLLTRYPIAGRTEAQRRAVVQAYLRAKRFLEIFDAWCRHGRLELSETPFEVFEVPVFVFFHLLCPAEARSSAVTLRRGDRQSWWGDPSLLDAAESGSVRGA